MIDYPYVECSSASLQALTAFAERFPEHRAREIARARERGRRFLLSIQRTGRVVVRLVGGVLHVRHVVRRQGPARHGRRTPTCAALRRRRVSVQADGRAAAGGRATSPARTRSTCSSLTTNDGGARPWTVVNTAWALLALVAAGQAERDREPLHAAAKRAMRAQCGDGDWPQQSIMGVFNNNCMITYANYRNVFPIWALGEYAKAVHGPGPSPRVEDAAAAKSAARAARRRARPSRRDRPGGARRRRRASGAFLALVVREVSGSSAALPAPATPLAAIPRTPATAARARPAGRCASSSQKQRTIRRRRARASRPAR